ncbi:hypothetical protein ACLBV5_14510 [Brevundimonas sp. M1A4_2e]|nr:hypothetical protein [Brevundimonas naejangsanensis]MCB7501132.1 hypothetical protein [Enterobacter roggenkampii]
MIDENTQAGTCPASGLNTPLSEIETLLERARVGEITESRALSRIAALASDAISGDIYQKPWG